MVGASHKVKDAIREAHRLLGRPEADMHRWMAKWSQNHHASVGREAPIMKEGTARSYCRDVADFDTYFDDSLLRMALQYFEVEKRRPDLANMIRSCVYNNAARHEIIYDPYPQGTKESGQLTWLARPTAPSDHAKTAEEIIRWRRRCEHGDESLYDHGKALFLFLQNSPLHEPYLRRFAPCLASVSISYGDYRDSILTAFWLRKSIESIDSGSDTIDEVARLDAHVVNRTFESAWTYLSFSEPFDSFDSRFRQGVFDKIDGDSHLDAKEQALLLKDAWRCYIRHAVNYRIHSLTDEELPPIRDEDRQDMVDKYSEAIDTAESLSVFTTGLDYDSWSRALAVLLERPDLALLEQEKTRRALHSEGVSIRPGAGVPFLHFIWEKTTEAMISLSSALCVESPVRRSEFAGDAERSLNSIQNEIGPTQMRHSRNYRDNLAALAHHIKESKTTWRR